MPNDIPALTEKALDRFRSKVHDSGSCWLWTAGQNSMGYGKFFLDGRSYYAHRVSWTTRHGQVQEGKHLDHACHTPLCVNPDHLREVTVKQNMENRTTAHANSKSGVRGVFWNKAKRRYRAVVAHNKRVIHVGYFDTIEEADSAVTAKRNELFTHNDQDRKAA